MRILTIFLAIVVAVSAAVSFAVDLLLPASAALVHAVAAPVIGGAAAILLIAVLFDRSIAAASPAAATAAAPGPARSSSPPPAAAPDNRHEAEVVNVLAIFQEKGRLVDFLMDDITGYSDAQVGTAARVVHEGCKAALAEHFGIKPVRQESEGAKVVVPTGYAPDDYRLVGKITGQAPFTGSLVHHGWRAEWVKLPRLIRTSPDRLPTIAPAEVELS
jgi:hypothetical protein